MSNLSGIYCPTCDKRGISTVMISLYMPNDPSGLAGMGVQCQACGLKTKMEILKAMNPRMVKVPFVETPPQGAIKMEAWVMPHALDALREKYPSNLKTTICAILTALSDGDTLMIEGEHVRKVEQECGLRIKCGRDVAGMAIANRDSKKELEEIRIQQKALEPLMKLLAAGNLNAFGGNASLGQDEVVLPGRRDA